jgi:5S rRNA maturation endonuclease (ribonuclease M5)
VAKVIDAYERVTLAIDAATGFHPTTAGGDWRCPAHDDSNASLSVNRGTNGAVVLHCHAGCRVDDVLCAIGMTKADLFDEAPKPKNEIVATYDYTDEHGELLFQVVRLYPKDFRQRRPDGNGGWEWKMTGTRRVPYRLPRVIDAVKNGYTVFIVEGEKDVHALEAAGEVATCNPGGAGKWRAEYAEHFTGADVVIVADKDRPGRIHARRVADSLEGKADRVVITEAVEGKDAADHLAAGYSADDLFLIDLAELEVLEEEPPPVEPVGEPPQEDGDSVLLPSPLEIIGAAELVRRVRSRPPVGWLIQPVWPADAYGVLAAEQKAGKTWANLDLVVSVASGTAWMGMYPVQRPGQVLVFLGEGGERKMLRRLEAICAQKGVCFEDLPIRLCFRVPHLTSGDHIERMRMELEAHPPVLVVVDPLYLAARGAKGSQLYEMGEHLETVQQVAQAHDAALLIVHHWNKTGEGKGAKRMTGVGPGEWGRVLISVSVRSKTTDKATRATQAVLDWEFEGDEIPEMETRTMRRVWSDDPDDLNSAMHYEITEVDMDDEEEGDPDGYSPSVRRVLDLLRDDWMTVQHIGDLTAESGRPLKKRTIQMALKTLHEDGKAQPFGTAGEAYRWRRQPSWATNEGGENG